jgi:dTDP-4-amino-4,6-dideoxygalactose transaminase
LSLPDALQTWLGDSYLLPYFGRDAIRLSILALRLRRGDRVLLPAYLDDAVIEPFIKEGVGIDFYRVTERLHADLEDLERALDRRTVKAVLIIHHEGVPQPMKQLVNMCANKGTPLIEDCAHVFPVYTKRDSVSGDIVLFSLRKFLPVPDGAILMINDKTIFGRAQELIERLPNYNSRATLKSSLLTTNLLLRRVLSKFPCVPTKLLTDISSRLCMKFPSGRRILRMTALSQAILKVLNLRECAEIRIRNYQFYEEACLFPSLLGKLPPECVPLTYPICVEESIRNRLLTHLHQNNVMAALHYHLPPSISSSRYPLSHQISRSVLNLPVHQDVSRASLEYTVDLVRGFFQK